ncbi:MAG: hypothetical protein QOF43_1145 [Gaiellaceae bacterium]|nr:hypothetical protein [Gaiellaceae bacterium]
MSLRIPALLPRAAVLVLAALGTTATLTYAAGRNLDAAAPVAEVAVSAPATIVVPDVRNQAYVFAKGSLEDAGFAWKVSGSVHGYAANTVASQSPPAGTKVLDTGAPLVTVTLKRNARYQQVGAAVDASPYAATPLRLAALAVQPVPATPVQAPVATPAAPKAKAKVPAKTPAAATPATKTPASPLQQRPADFVIPGARKEPLDEMPLTQRALALQGWLAKHPKPTNTNVKYWLFQNAWIVTGAKLGWWHGAEALKTLVAVDQHAQSTWGYGAKSAQAAKHALTFVTARSKR